MLGRLRTAADFEQVRARGGRWRGKLCVLNAARQAGPSPVTSAQPSSTPETSHLSSTPATAVQPALTRVGYITSKKIGKAVQRNRARRLLREAMRHLSDSIVEGWDIVLIAQPRLTTARPRMQDVKDELKWLLGQAKLIPPPPPAPVNPLANLSQANLSPASPSPSTSPRAPSPAES